MVVAFEALYNGLTPAQQAEVDAGHIVAVIHGFMGAPNFPNPLVEAQVVHAICTGSKFVP